MKKLINININLGGDGVLGVQGLLNIRSLSPDVEADPVEMDSHGPDDPPDGNDWAVWIDPATGEEIPLYSRLEADSFGTAHRRIQSPEE